MNSQTYALRYGPPIPVSHRNQYFATKIAIPGTILSGDIGGTRMQMRIRWEIRWGGYE